MQTLQFSKKAQSKKLHIPLLGLSLVLLISFASPTSSCTEQEQRSLLQFLAGLSHHGGLAASWKDGMDCCKWKGITCSPNRTVTNISLASRHLEGRLSPSLGNLTGLQHLNLTHNTLYGALPLELLSSGNILVIDVSFNRLDGELHDLASSTPSRPLQVLNISSNLFTGRFPSTTWEVMNNLVALNASNNSFTGNIPAHICNSSPLFVMLELCFNHFSGTIPPGFGNCSMLKVLKVGHNNLSGGLPHDIFNATSLEYLSFPNNNLYGVLDGARIINLRNLATLDLGENGFSGHIPYSVGELKKLQELHLDHNNMSGELPSALSNCTDLITIDLKSNHFSGILAKVNFSNLPNLKTLDLLYNNFSGTIPESIYSCSNLIALRLSGNKLKGQLSPRIVDLKCLTFLSIADNSFRNIANALSILKGCKNLTTLFLGENFRGEQMPEDDILDGFENLQVLAINECSLLGKIPHWLSKMTNLEVLFLSGNQFTGPIPHWISRLNLLFCLDIRNNSLTGGIPTALMDMQMLKSEKTEAHLDRMVFELAVYRGQSRQYRVPTAFPKVLDLSNNNSPVRYPWRSVS